LIFSPYFHPHVGGLEGYVSDLNEVLLDGPDVEAITVFTPRLPPEGPAAEDRCDGYRVIRYPAFELISNFPVPKLWSRRFWSALRATRPTDHDVFVGHTRFFLSSAFALGIARVLRRPLLHVEHGSDYVQLSGRFPRAAARTYDLLLGRLLLRRADEVIAISRAAADFVARLAGRQAKVVHRGMRVERLEATIPDARVLDWADGRLTIAFAGRLIDGKAVPDLLNAFARLDGQPVLCVVGDGPRRAQLESLAHDLAISDRVLFLGYLPERQAWGVIKAADIVVNPSYTEGLPTSVLEAALMGKAVVASDVGGTPEVIADGKGGLLYGARDVAGLQSRLARLICDADLRTRLGVAARADAMGEFDWQSSAGRFAAIARELVARGDA
jgi:glycosyltransferase involved in cell wall biosynthesis